MLYLHTGVASHLGSCLPLSTKRRGRLTSNERELIGGRQHICGRVLGLLKISYQFTDMFVKFSDLKSVSINAEHI